MSFIGPLAPEVNPTHVSSFNTVKVPFVYTLRYVSGFKILSLPGIIYFPGFPDSIFERYTLIGIVELFLLKYKSTAVKNAPPSNFSILKDCESGFGFV